MRKILTEVLLEVTDEMIKSITSECLQVMKEGKIVATISVVIYFDIIFVETTSIFT